MEGSSVTETKALELGNRGQEWTMVAESCRVKAGGRSFIGRCFMRRWPIRTR